MARQGILSIAIGFGSLLLLATPLIGPMGSCATGPQMTALGIGVLFIASGIVLVFLDFLSYTLKHSASSRTDDKLPK
jgi:hypothetical protein